MAGTPFQVTVTDAFQGTINCWEDNHQDPVLYTFYDSTQFVPDDDQWDEFHYNQRDYPGVFAGQTENPPVMKFYTVVPNGTYRVIANFIAPMITGIIMDLILPHRVNFRWTSPPARLAILPNSTWARSRSPITVSPFTQTMPM